jgi:hypothetical protein
MARFALLAAVLMFAAVARADRVHLLDGAVIEGKATREGDRVVIEVDSGRLALAADQVARIEPASSPVQQIEQRRARLEARDVAGRMALANYCRDHGMSAREHELLREVIELSPDHAEARARLGYVRDGGGWTTREQSLRAQGLVQHEGRWLTQQQVLEIERLRAQAQTASHERDKAQAELEAKRAELEVRKRELELAANAREPRVEEPPEPIYSPVLAWPAWYAFIHHHDRVCRGERCERRPPRKPRTDGRPAWPIVGTKDPFDYLR